MREAHLPDIRVPPDMAEEDMPDLLRFWYLGSKARRHMALRRFLEVHRELAGDLEGPVLDIGSAWGYNVMALEARGVPSVGLDLVTDQFRAGRRIASENGIEFRVVGGDAAALPFESSVFQSVTMVETFEHIFEADRLRALRECRRVLGSRGRLILSTPNHGSVVERLKRFIVRHPALQRRLPTMCYPVEGVERSGYHPYCYHRPWSDRQLDAALRSAGFHVRSLRHFLFVVKNTPDAAFGAARLVEKLLEKTPLVRRWAATTVVVAEKSD